MLLFCYDIIPVKFPHLCVGDVASKFGKYFANLAWCADAVLCISERSRDDLKSLLFNLGTPIPKMDVIRLGCDVTSSCAEASMDISSLLERKFILFVSTIERRKNHEAIYRAYARLLDEGFNDLPIMLFVGMPGWGVNDFLSDLHLDPRTKSYIHNLSHVTDADLSLLYQNALFTVYPSLYEGWGLPIAESLRHGKFCLASNAASMPEVGGDFIEYIDPLDVPMWASRMKWYIENPMALLAKERRIKKQYVANSWKCCASSIFDYAKAVK